METADPRGRSAADVPALEALREGAPLPTLEDLEKTDASETDGGGWILACAGCRRPITSAAARIQVGGAHAHSFLNPHGIEFRIGCFGLASGLLRLGDPETFWTWFPGHTWQVELCASCREHLGWEFRSSDHRFHGLILDRLVSLEERP
jgi:hypothetical protein